MKIGDIKTDKHYHKWIWLACVDCGKERWVFVRKGKPESTWCHYCNNRRKTYKPLILFPLQSDKEAYTQFYGKDLESHYDTAENTKYRQRIFCLDCPDFETCKGSLWEHCPTRAEVLGIIKGSVVNGKSAT